MKSLLKNYVEKLTIIDLENFSIKNSINLNTSDLEYILNLLKNNFEDILINDDKYLDLLEKKINKQEFIKIKELYLLYKSKYKGYLF